ncbi:hypothetical protein [Thermomonas sp.]
MASGAWHAANTSVADNSGAIGKRMGHLRGRASLQGVAVTAKGW